MNTLKLEGSEVNKMIRVLQNGDHRLKHTARLHWPDGRVVEWQTNEPPKVKWHDEDRALWVFSGPYSADIPVMKFPEGGILLCEENPK